MHADAGDRDICGRGAGELRPGRRGGGLLPETGEVLHHLRAVLRLERSWQHVQQRAVKSHQRQAFLVTKPLARAIRTRSASRFASSFAAARPVRVRR